MRVIVVGAGATGAALARRLSRRHEVHLLDVSGEALEGLEGDQVTTHQVDGTSRLHLERVLGAEQVSALVAAGGSDAVNREAGRVANKLGFDPVVVLQHEPTDASLEPPPYTVLDRGALLADHIERSLAHQGAVVPTGIGLGRGELVEVRLVATSPVVDRPLKDLAPDRWRIAAVFRGDELIVPTGDTRLAVDDRVLLVGDPALLPGVAEYIRLGVPQFPRPYGPNVVSLERDGDDEGLGREARGVAEACPRAVWVRGLPGDAEVDPEGSEGPRSFAFGSLDDGRLVQALRSHPGVVVVRPFPRSLLSRVTGRLGVDAGLCDQLAGPVLFARGSFPYKRILLPVSSSQLSVEAAEVAIDVTRQLGASLTAVNVDLPAYISGQSEEEIHHEVLPVRKLCQLYDVPLEYRHHLGNPVRLVLAESRHHDLVILARRRRRADSYFNPDVALRIARQAACSALVISSGAVR